MEWFNCSGAGWIYLYTNRNYTCWVINRDWSWTRVTESLAGQLITSYALGSLLAAIPLTTATQAWRRKPLLLLCIVGFLLFNTITAFSFNYTLTLIARFLAGVTAGILWG